jgi:cytidine deaminase
MDGASPATFARRYVEASVIRVEGMAADEMEHEAIARAYVDASEMRVGAMLRASGN